LYIEYFPDPEKISHYSLNTKTIVPTLTGKWSLHFDGTPDASLTVMHSIKP